MSLIGRLPGPMPAAMSSFACRLLALVAVLLMPLGMSAAPAAAPHDEHMSAMPMQHCPQPDQAPAGKAALADCMMACSAALPAADLPAMAAPLPLRGLVEPGFIPALAGIELEIATPPPRSA
jgi:hypothetical protein